MGTPEDDDARRKMQIAASGHVKLRLAQAILESAPYQDRGAPYGHRAFSKRTVQALVDCSIDAPERLLFMSESQLRSIPGIGKAAIVEIKTYRRKFLSPDKS